MSPLVIQFNPMQMRGIEGLHDGTRRMGGADGVAFRCDDQKGKLHAFDGSDVVQAIRAVAKGATRQPFADLTDQPCMKVFYTMHHESTRCGAFELLADVLPEV